MFKSFIFSFIIIFFCFYPVQAQNEKQVSIEDNFTIEDFGFTEKGHFYTLELAKKMDYKSRYRVWGANLELLSTITNEKI